MKKFLPALKILAELFLILVSFFVAIGVAYYFTWTLLIGKPNWGSDFPYIASLVNYLVKWYPYIPNWNYTAAGGMPFLAPYPPMAAFSTLFYHLATGWSIVKSMRFLAWLSVPMAAVAVAVLGRLLTKNWLIGILAGVMMLFSPDSWIWMTFGGFYAFSLAAPVFAWSLVSFVLAFKLNRRFFWALAVIFYALTWLFHPMDGVLSALFSLILGIGLAKEQREIWWRGASKAGLVIIGGIFLILWWLIPFYLVRQNGGIAAEQISFIPLKELIGLTPPSDSYITSTFFAASVALLFGIGIIAAFVRKSLIRYLVICSLLALFIVTCAGFLPKFIVNLIGVFLRSTNVRAAVGLRILGPIVAAYGAASVIRPIFWLIERKFKSLAQNNWWKSSVGILCGIFGFLVFAYTVRTVIVIPHYPPNQEYYYRGFGPLYNWLGVTKKNGVIYSDFGKVFPSLQETLSRVSKFQIQVDDSDWDLNRLIVAASQKAGFSNKDRVEISPYASSVAVSLNSGTDITQISAIVGISLITRMVGWQVPCFYLDPSCSSAEIEDLSRWFGISSIWAGPSGTLGQKGETSLVKVAASKLFRHETYNLVNSDGKEVGWETYNFTQATGLASFSTKPALLVIGDNPPNSDVFDTVFRGLSKVNFGYEDAWSVKGKRFVDDYNPTELKQFNLIILHGYRYHSRDNAWKLMEDYVNSGGSLFVDTGWQYMNSDWGKIAGNGGFEEISLPPVLPVSKTVWGDVGKEWNINLQKNAISEGVGVKEWGSLTWNGQPWGIALSQFDWLRQGANPLITDNGKILVASWNFGKGKVVWTGFDFWGHLNQSRGSDETLFVNHLLTWLTGGNSSSFVQKIDFTRINPDLVRIDLTPKVSDTKLLFKEVNTPNWIATLNAGGKRQSLKIYSAGPGWKIVFLPKIDGKTYLIFQFRKTFVEILGIIISGLTGIGILFYISGLHKNVLARFKENTEQKLQQDAKKIKEAWQSE